MTQFKSPDSPPVPQAPPIDPTVLVSPALNEATLAEAQSLPIVKLGVLASGSGSNFEALIQAIASGELRAEIPLLIYNNPGAKVAARAARWGIPAILVNHRDYASREAFDYEIVQLLRQHGVEWLAMAGWMRCATNVLVEAFLGRAVNLHPSLLPSFPGLRAIEQALAAGVTLAGCTAHLVELEVDRGPILIQAAVPVLPDDTAETLHARIQVQEHRILPRAIALAVARSLQISSPVNQN